MGYTNESSGIYNKGECLIFDDFTMDYKWVNFPFKIKSTAIKILTSKKDNLLFLYNMMQKMKFEPLGHNRHYINVVQNFNILVPYINEQQKIAKFFSLLDKQISLWERKLELYELFYKYYLNRLLFVSNKFKFPLLRFKGFEGEWDQIFLDESIDINTGKKDLKDKNDNGIYPFYVRSEKIEKINTYSFNGEAILIPGDGKIGDIFHYINGKFDYHQRVYKLSNKINSNINLKYLYYEFQKNIKKYLLSFSAKATVDSIRLPMLQKYKIFIPESYEQQKIANFLSIISKLKDYFLNSVNKMKTIKNNYLSKLFI